MSQEDQKQTKGINPADSADSKPSEKPPDENKVTEFLWNWIFPIGIFPAIALVLFCLFHIVFVPLYLYNTPLRRIRSGCMPTTATISERCGSTYLQLSATPDELWSGDTVEIEFSVKNIDDEREQKYFSENEPVMDISIPTGYDGQHIIYTYWSDGRSTTQEMRSMVLGPGESKSITMKWTAPEGFYVSGPVVLKGVLRDDHAEDGISCEVSLPYCVNGCGV